MGDNTMDLTGLLAHHRLLGIVRGSDPHAAVRTAETLVDAGVGLLEVSLTTTDAPRVLRAVVDACGDHAAVGAGTVLTAHDLDTALDAGARYVVTPALGDGVPAAVARGIPVLAGAFTPTEVHTAHLSGASAVKVFPAGALGPDYVRALRDPFPHIDLVPVGGVGADDVRAYLDAGALAVGIAGPLAGDAPHGGDLNALQKRAQAFLAAVGNAVEPR